MPRKWMPWGLALITWLLAIAYLGTQGDKLIQYWQRSMQAPAEIVSWHIQEVNQGKYAVEATYTFQVQETSYQHSSWVSEEVFRNESAANHALERLQTFRSWTVWYQEGRPENNSLEHSFPLKELISFSLLMAIGVYFLVIGYFVARRL